MRASTAFLASLVGFFGAQGVLWLLQPPGCSLTDVLAVRSGCTASLILLTMHAIVGCLVGVIIINAIRWFYDRAERRRRRDG